MLPGSSGLGDRPVRNENSLSSVPAEPRRTLLDDAQLQIDGKYVAPARQVNRTAASASLEHGLALFHEGAAALPEIFRIHAGVADPLDRRHVAAALVLQHLG